MTELLSGRGQGTENEGSKDMYLSSKLFDNLSEQKMILGVEDSVKMLIANKLGVYIVRVYVVVAIS